MDTSSSVIVQKFSDKHISKSDISQIQQNYPDSKHFVGILVPSLQKLTELQKEHENGQLIMIKQTKYLKISVANSKKIKNDFEVYPGMSLSELQKELLKDNFISPDASVCFKSQGTVLPDDFVFSDIPDSLVIVPKKEKTDASRKNNNEPISLTNSSENFNSRQSLQNNSKRELEQPKQNNEAIPTPITTDKYQVQDDDLILSINPYKNLQSPTTINDSLIFEDLSHQKVTYSAKQENIDENNKENQEIFELVEHDSNHGKLDGDLSLILLNDHENKNDIKFNEENVQKIEQNSTNQSNTYISDDFGPENEKIIFNFYYYTGTNLILYKISLSKSSTINDAKEILKKFEEFEDGKFYIILNGKKLDSDSKICNNELKYYIQKYVEVNVKMYLPIRNNTIIELNTKSEVKSTDNLQNIILYTGDLTGIYLKDPTIYINNDMAESPKSLVSSFKNEFENKPLKLKFLNKLNWDVSIIVLKITGEIKCRIKVKPKDTIDRVKNKIKSRISNHKDFELKNSNNEKLELTDLVEDIILTTKNTRIVANYI